MKRWVGLSLALIAAASVSVGCSGAPRLKPGMVGIGSLTDRPTDKRRGPSAEQLPRLEADRPSYEIGSGDQLVVVVWGRPDLGSQVPGAGDAGRRISIVQEDGTVSLPYLGSLSVAGQTTAEVAELVRSRYAPIVESPQVEVQLASCGSRSVFLQGAFVKPEPRFLCHGQMTLDEVIASSGGLAAEVDKKRGLLIREDAPFTLDYARVETGASNAGAVLLEAGDKIYFPTVDQRMVYVFGEVARPGALTIPAEGMTLLAALGAAQGYNVISARTDRIFLVRPTDGSVHRLKLADVLAAPDIALMDGDRLYVPTTKLAKWNRWWRQIIPLNPGTVNLVRGD